MEGPTSSVLTGHLKQVFMQEAVRRRLNMLLSGDLKRFLHNKWFEAAQLETGMKNQDLRKGKIGDDLTQKLT